MYAVVLLTNRRDGAAALPEAELAVSLDTRRSTAQLYYAEVLS